MSPFNPDFPNAVSGICILCVPFFPSPAPRCSAVTLPPSTELLFYFSFSPRKTLPSPVRDDAVESARAPTKDPRELHWSAVIHWLRLTFKSWLLYLWFPFVHKVQGPSGNFIPYCLSVFCLMRIPAEFVFIVPISCLRLTSGILRVSFPGSVGNSSRCTGCRSRKYQRYSFSLLQYLFQFRKPNCRWLIFEIFFFGLLVVLSNLLNFYHFRLIRQQITNFWNLILRQSFRAKVMLGGE